MANGREVRLPIKTTGADKAQKQLGKVDKGLGRLAKTAAKTAFAFLGARMLLDGMRSVIDAAREQELQERKLAAVIKSTGGAAGVTSREMLNLASALQKQTRFGDEAVIQAQSLMLTFTKVGKEVMPDAIETVLNMSEAMGQDLRMTTIQVGKALNDPILGVTALRRVGVQLSEQQEKQLRDFMAVNDIAGAQAVILGELETQFGGLARAAAEGLAGSLDQAKNAMGDAAEDLGNLLAPALINISKRLSNASTNASNFFMEIQETDLETTIRELGELGVETLKYQKIISELALADLNRASELGTEKQLTEDLNNVAQEYISKKLELADLQGTAAKEARTEKDIQEEIRKKNIEINDLRMAREGGRAKEKEQEVELLRLELEKFEKLKEEIAEIEKRKEKTAEDLQLLKEYNAEKERLGVINAELAKQGTEGGSEDGGKQVELMFLTEAQKTQILKDAAEERKLIQQDEQIGAMTMEAFKASLDLLGLTEKQKTKIVEDEVKRRRKAEEQAHKKKIEENLQTAILQGQSAKEAALSVIKAEVAEAQAGLISSIMKSLPFPVNLAVAAGAGSMIGKVTDKLLSFQTGGSFITKGRTTLPIGNGVVVGDNASGMERIDVTPLPSPTSSGNNITINISAPLVDETVVESIIPAIRRAEKLGL